MLLHDCLIIVFQIQRQEVIFEEDFELINEKFAILDGLLLLEPKVEVDSRTLIQSMHWDGK